MSTHGSIAKAERLRKLARPSSYCSGDPRCLWNVARSGPCPKHEGDALVPTERLEAIIDASSMADAYTRGGRRPSQRAFRARLAYGSPPIIPGSDVRPSEGLKPVMFREPGGEWYPLLTVVAGGAS